MKILKDKQIVLNIVFIILCALMIYPLLMVIAVSLSSEADIAKFGYQFIPEKIDFSAYEYIFKNVEYQNTKRSERYHSKPNPGIKY